MEEYDEGFSLYDLNHILWPVPYLVYMSLQN